MCKIINPTVLRLESGAKQVSISHIIDGNHTTNYTTYYNDNVKDNYLMTAGAIESVLDDYCKKSDISNKHWKRSGLFSV